jgi:hypothetical protein
MNEQELQQHLNDIQLWYLQGNEKNGANILLKKICDGIIIKHDKVRELICLFGREYAYNYAHYVDKQPRDDTRLVACNVPGCAFLYAYYVDKCSRGDTRNAAYKNQNCKKWYIEEFGE